MSDGLIPRRYAKALYKYATEIGDAQEIYELLKGLSFRYTAIDELKRAVLNPEISDEAKGAYMLKLAGGKPGSSLDKFLLLCVRNNRTEYLQKISLAYVDLYLSISTASSMRSPTWSSPRRSPCPRPRSMPLSTSLKSAWARWNSKSSRSSTPN